MLPLKLFLFGTPRLTQDKDTIHIGRRKTLALLAYLAATKQAHARDALLTLLWPEYDSTGARSNLRRTLSDLRKYIGADMILADRAQIEFIDSGKLWVDVHQFRAHRSLPHQHEATLCETCLQALTTAADLYQADYMHGFSLPDAPTFNEWVFFEREKLQQQLGETLHMLMQHHASVAEYNTAIQYAQRKLMPDPLHEPTQRLLMKLYAQSGQQAAAIRQYEHYVQVLKNELGVEPEEETIALFEAIRTQKFVIPKRSQQLKQENKSPLYISPSSAPQSRYEIQEPLATGGHGEVFLGLDRVNGETVVIKRLRAELLTENGDFVTRFAREGEALRQANHPNIVNMLATYEQDGQHLIVMEYVPGGSLRDLLDVQVRLSTNKVLDIGLELADALGRAHHLQIIHRDLKPENVLLAKDGTPRLTDFGVARLEKESVNLTPDGSLLGSPAYMSPEALRGEPLDARSDIWSFGVLLYEMVSGQRPFTGNQITAVMLSILNDPLPDLVQLDTNVPQLLANLINRLLVKDRNQRMDSMRLVSAELESIRAGKTPTPFPSMQTPIIEDDETANEEQVESDLHLIPNNLPVEVTQFIGRTTEKTALLNQLQKEETRLITITGAGGMGKTRLSIAVGRQFIPIGAPLNEHLFPNGIFFIELASLQTADLISVTIAQTLSLRDEAQLHTFLQDKKMLLILDNFEHLLDGAAIIDGLLQAAPGLKLLVSSRERLRLHGEQLFPIEGLDAFSESQPGSAASELFLKSAQLVDPNFDPNELEWEAIVKICRMVAGMPLALKLAASWIDMLSPKEIADEIAQNLDFLATELINVPDRHRSVRAAIDTSWRQLTPEQQQQFTKLSIFRGGFARGAAQQIAGVSLRALSHFANKSFLTFQRESKRYTMHEMLRQFAAEQLAKDALLQQQTAVDHALHFGNILGNWRWFTPEQKLEETFNAITQDIDNVRASWHYLVATHRFDMVERGYVSLSRYYLQRGSIPEGERLIAQALQQLPSTNQDLQAKLNLAQAHLWRLEADYEAVIAAVKQAIILGEATKNHQIIAAALFEWGAVLWLMGQFDLCRQKLNEALPLARQTNLPILEADILRHLGLIAWRQRELDTAENYFEQAITLFRAHQSLEGEANALNNLGMLAHERDQFLEALAFMKQSVALFKKIGYRAGAARALTNQSNLEWILGDAVSAIEHAKQALLIHQQANIQRGIAVSLAWLGVYHAGLGLLDTAQTYIEQGVALCKKIGAQHDLISLLIKKSQWALQVADYQTAYDVAQEGLQLSHQHGVLLNRDSLMCCCGRALFELEQYAASAEAYRDALHFQREYGLTARTIEPLAGLARIAFANNDLPQAIDYCDTVLPMLTPHNDIIFDALHIDLTCYHILSAVNDIRAGGVLQDAVDYLQERARKIYDYTLRRSFLEAVPTHRALLAAYTVSG